MITDLRGADPASVGPYRLLGRLGAGGMGQVYLAKSPGGRLVAIKLIRPELAEERGFRARFASEISAARNVSGIYTAAVVDADADAELPWMATVYVAGPSLTDAVEEYGPLPVKSVLALAGGLAEALAAIHRVGLVHRDLKPSNVLLAGDGPRVIDFGISLALERSMMTATGMVMGSPGFMSPEQARGQREVGAPTDVFSLGAVLAYAATGDNPFGGGPTPALLYRVVNEVPDLTAVPPRLSPLVGQCLAKDPAARPTPEGILALLGEDVGVLTGEWLPPPVTAAMSRYTPTLATPLPPGLREAGQGAAPLPAGPGAGPGQAPGMTPVPTVLAAVTPAPLSPPPAAPAPVPPWPGPAPVAATVAEPSLLPETSLVRTSGANRSAGWDAPGRTGGSPPLPPPAPSPFRRWRWPIAAAAAAVIVAPVGRGQPGHPARYLGRADDALAQLDPGRQPGQAPDPDARAHADPDPDDVQPARDAQPERDADRARDVGPAEFVPADGDRISPRFRLAGRARIALAAAARRLSTARAGTSPAPPAPSRPAAAPAAASAR